MNAQQQKTRLLKAEDIAVMLGLKVQTVYTMARRGFALVFLESFLVGVAINTKKVVGGGETIIMTGSGYAVATGSPGG